MGVADLRCDRCNREMMELYLSRDLSAPNVEIIGFPWYCADCMRETGQPLETARVTDCRKQ